MKHCGIEITILSYCVGWLVGNNLQYLETLCVGFDTCTTFTIREMDTNNCNGYL